MLLQRSLTLKDAEKITDTALKLARQEKLEPLGVAVLDSDGNIVVIKTEDGSGTLRVEISVGKASAALAMGSSSRGAGERLEDRPAFQNAISAAANGKYIPAPGGVLIVDDKGFAIGAVGVTGDTSGKDEYCAISAVQAAGFKSDPPQPDPDWNEKQ